MVRTLNNKFTITALKLLTATAFCWLSLYSTFHTYSPQLETSWNYAINAAHSHGLIFGTDILFTYGPLGYLFVPFPMDGHIGHAVGIQLVLLSVWLILITRISLTLSYYRMLAVILLLLVVQQDLPFLWLVTTTTLCLYISTTKTREAIIGVIPCCLLVAFSLLTKFSLGIATGSALGSALAIRAVLYGKSSRTVWAFAIGTSITAIIYIAYRYFGGIGPFITWLHGVLEVTSGYSSTMQIIGPPHQVVIALVCLAVLLITITLNLFNENRHDRYIMLIVVLPIFLGFKLGFVRQDGHVINFFSIFALLACSTLLFFRSKRAFITALPLAVFSVTSYCYIASGLDHSPNQKKHMAANSITITDKMIHLHDAVQSVEESMVKNFAAKKIDDTFLQSIITSTTTVDPIPWDTTVIPANGFMWRPAPVFQFYSAYTPYLDGLNADHYAGDRGADILLCRFQSIDIRHIIWDTPKTWRSIFKHYEWSGDIPDREISIMTRRDEPAEAALRSIGQTIAAVGEPIAIPEMNERLYAELPFDYSAAGLAKKTLFRLPPLYLQINYDDGSIRHWKVTPENAADGLLINCVPQTPGAFNQLLQGTVTRRATSLTIHGPGASCYNWPIEITWKTDDAPLAFP